MLNHKQSFHLVINRPRSNPPVGAFPMRLASAIHIFKHRYDKTRNDIARQVQQQGSEAKFNNEGFQTLRAKEALEAVIRRSRQDGATETIVSGER